MEPSSPASLGAQGPMRKISGGARTPLHKTKKHTGISGEQGYGQCRSFSLRKSTTCTQVTDSHCSPRDPNLRPQRRGAACPAEPSTPARSSLEKQPWKEKMDQIKRGRGGAAFACRLQAEALTRAFSSLVFLCENVPLFTDFQESCQV